MGATTPTCRLAGAAAKRSNWRSRSLAVLLMVSSWAALAVSQPTQHSGQFAGPPVPASWRDSDDVATVSATLDLDAPRLGQLTPDQAAAVRGAVESLVKDQGVTGLSRVAQGGGAYPVTRSGYTFDRMPLNVYVNAPKRRLPELLSRMQTIGENSELAGAIRGRGMYDVGTAAFTRYSLASGKEVVSLDAADAPASPSPPAPAGVATQEEEEDGSSKGKAASGSFAASAPAGEDKGSQKPLFEVPILKAPGEKKEKGGGGKAPAPSSPTPKAAAAATPAPPPPSTPKPAPPPRAALPPPPPATPAPTLPPPPPPPPPPQTPKPARIKPVDLGLELSGSTGGDAAANFTAEREKEVREALSAALGIDPSQVQVKASNATKAARRRGRSLSQYYYPPSRERGNSQASSPAPPDQAPSAAAAAPSSSPSQQQQQPWKQRLSVQISPNSTAQAGHVRDALLGGKLVAAREDNGTAIDSPLVAALSDAGWDEVEDAAISSVDGRAVAGSAAALASNSKSPLSGGAVAGIVIGVLLLALALAALGAFVMARRRGGGGVASDAAEPKKKKTAAASWFASLGGGGGAAQNGNGAADAPAKLASSRSTDLEVAAAKAAALAPLAAPSSRHSSSTAAAADLASHKLDIEAATSPAVEEKAGRQRFMRLFGGNAATAAGATSSRETKEAISTPLPPPPPPPPLPQPNYEPAEPGLGTEQVVAGARRDLASIAAAGVSSLRRLAASAAVGTGTGAAAAAAAGGGATAAAAGSPHKQQHQHQPSSSKESTADDPVSQAEAAIAALAARGTPYAGKYALSRQGPVLPAGTSSSSSSSSKSRPTTVVYPATELAPPGRACTATFYLSDEQFRHEASLAARLPPGDVTPEVLDAYAAGDAPGARALPACVVAEAADYSLEAWPERRARAPDAVQRRAVLALVAKAVAGAHARGVVHGSLRPSAVLWFSGANAMRLGELARWAPAGGRAPLHAEARYAAPEVLAAFSSTGDRRADARADARAVVAASSAADAWSLGAIAYQIFTDEPLFPAGTTVAELKEALLGEGGGKEKKSSGGGGALTTTSSSSSSSSSSPVMLFPWEKVKGGLAAKFPDPAVAEVVAGLLRREPSKRLDAAGVLSSPLFRGSGLRAASLAATRASSAAGGGERQQQQLQVESGGSRASAASSSRLGSTAALPAPVAAARPSATAAAAAAASAAAVAAARALRPVAAAAEEGDKKKKKGNDGGGAPALRPPMPSTSKAEAAALSAAAARGGSAGTSRGTMVMAPRSSFGGGGGGGDAAGSAASASAASASGSRPASANFSPPPLPLPPKKSG